MAKKAPSGINTAEEATNVALNFIKKHRWWARPLRAIQENGIWLVEVDVGPVYAAVAKVKIDAKSGDILEYSIPQ
ncbi:MAG: hypothetical protein HYX79_03950 [Chloroflexi bacterium]|nr:hypothetical protein [Chloroflexota bacterium]